ncbi:MAG: 1-(5-phosphoribosyl)-5-[(5-phosphoribosylamino)methylideneamino]imidazole-4-carboxamide isomerase [Actinobacteria bacterium]|nr:1-(5-phosphoribosyl)-5-[(5-phosphoribosylamino)methylideneamino]imidazole-4-carboxamide isomerase [Actinomycetota bacterium]
MNGFTVYPAVDIRQGKCVRLFQGKPEEQTVFHQDAVEAARIWQHYGARFLHVVDLDGALEGRPVNRDLIFQLVNSVTIPVQIGGGIRDMESARAYIEAGAKRVIIGTGAFASDISWLEEAVGELGESLVVGLDAKRGRISVAGWTETKEMYLYEAVQILQEIGVPRIVYTNILRDGTLSGPDFESIQKLARETDIPIIASGGVRVLEDVIRLRELEPQGVEGVIIGMALYQNTVNLQQIYQTLDTMD